MLPEQTYVVLRTEDIMVPTMDGLGMGTRSFPRMPSNVKVEEATLTGGERNDLRRDPRTKAIAPLMPMTLIEPVSQSQVSETDCSSKPTATWGIEAVRAPESSYDGSGITVAVLDTGIEPDHPAFAGVNLVQRNFTTEVDHDINGHGTHCAGTILGRDVNGTRIGVAQGIEQAVIAKVLGEGGGSSLTVTRAIQWAINQGANVISMSLGIDFPGFVDFLVQRQGLDVRPATSIALEAYRANINLFTELAEYVQSQNLFGQGSIIVAASGNESNRPNYEIAVAPPAAGTGVIAVGALQQGDAGLTIANFSNDQVNISAPGVEVTSAWIGGGLMSISGTSMATPHVSGVAALWAQKQLQERGTIDNQLLMGRLIASGTMAPLAADSQPEDVGSGLVQAPVDD
ncbi:MAG: S8 family serine peptidase [Cyanobacteria bacterium P01_A01_bin.105]